MKIQTQSFRAKSLATLVCLALLAMAACQKSASGGAATQGSSGSDKGATSGSADKDSANSTGSGSGTSLGRATGSGSGSGSTTSIVAGGAGSGTAPGIALTMTAAAFLSQLNGSWQQGCAKIAGSDNYTTLDMQLDAVQKTFTSQSQTFYDHNCQEPVYDLSIDDGNFAVDGPSQLISGAFGVNLSEDTDDGTNDAYTTWQIINGQLFLGDMSEAGYDGATPLTRPRKLDLGRPLTHVASNSSGN